MNPSPPIIALRERARAVLILSLILSTSACMTPELPMRPPKALVSPIEVGTRVHRRVDPNSGAVLRRWSVTTGAEGLALLDGQDEGWWPNGERRHDRVWNLGEEAGTWRSWHENGALRSLADFNDSSGVMRFWHPNGVLSAEGVHEGGTRVGVWTFWYESGSPSSEGECVKNRREGPWSFWTELGEIKAAGVYAAGDRVGDWYLAPSDPGEQDES